MQVALIATFDGFDKVGEVGLVIATRPLTELLAVVVKCHTRGVVWRDGIACRAPPDSSHTKRTRLESVGLRGFDLQAAHI